MSPRPAKCLIFLALLLLPGAIGHGETPEEHGSIPIEPRQKEPAFKEGYTGPGREPYLSYVHGSWLYGKMSLTPLAAQRPVDLDIDGDWLVWEDAARSDIFLYNVPAAQGFYITNDRWKQHDPQVSNGVVVWEDRRDVNHAQVYAYVIETGETRRLSNSTSNARDPSISHPYVSWVDENITNPDIWAYSFMNNTAFLVHGGTDRDSDPVVVDGRAYWRSYRFNIWDIIGFDFETEEILPITTDADIQSSPFDNGEDLLFLTNVYQLGWELFHYDDERDIVRTTNIKVADTSRMSVSGDGMLRVVFDADYQELTVRNMTTGATNHVSGDLSVISTPVLQGKTAYVPIYLKTGPALLVLDISPFAFAKRPSLTIASPASEAPWLRPLVMSGLLQAGPEFTEPTTFTYRVDDQPPQVIPASAKWRVTLDPTDMGPGRHYVTVRATFREGPPITEGIVLVVPASSDSIDVARAGPAFHAARLMGEVHAYVLDNPAAWVLMPLILLILVLVVIRAWLWIKPRRARAVVEYVGPDD